MSAIKRYSTPAAFRAALRDRLRRVAIEKGESWLIHQRKLMVFDRLLARLLIAAPDRWILKGAVALDFRFGDRARTTMDLDLARQDDEDAATSDLLAAQAIDLGDFFTFSIERIQRLSGVAEGAVRYRVRADIDGSRFEEVTLDIGFADPLELLPDLLQGPDLFGFAGIPSIAVPALTLNQHVAEKLHAYTRDYGGRQSSRVKDLVDLVLISSTAEFEAGRLRHEIDRTFASRGTQSVPESVPAPPESWDTPYRRLASEIDLNPDVAVGHRRTVAFLDPILSGNAPTGARWNPEEALWK